MFIKKGISLCLGGYGQWFLNAKIENIGCKSINNKNKYTPISLFTYHNSPNKGNQCVVLDRNLQEKLYLKQSSQVGNRLQGFDD